MKYSLILIALLLACSAAPTEAVPTPPCANSSGDVNADGAVNLNDCFVLRDYIFVDPWEPLADCCACGKMSGDCNADGSVNLVDLLLLYAYIFSPAEPPIATCCGGWE